ncbi:MAG: RsmE family RNA methyltransferase [Planctomycetota bacterium]
MAVPRFYIEALSTGTVRLAEAESMHAGRSRRLSVGDSVVLFDGRGKEAAGKIASAGRGVMEVRVEQVVSLERPRPVLTLAVALPKGPRQEVIIEKCTELGVGGIQPILAKRSVCSASDHKLSRWRKKTIEAAKQSGQCWLPAVYEPVSVEVLLAGTAGFDAILMAVSQGDNRLESRPAEPITGLFGELCGLGTILALVGPEGGWTDGEIEAVLAGGGRPIGLGPNILRIETAAVVLAGIIHGVAGSGE